MGLKALRTWRLFGTRGPLGLEALKGLEFLQAWRPGGPAGLEALRAWSSYGP